MGSKSGTAPETFTKKKRKEGKPDNTTHIHTYTHTSTYIHTKEFHGLALQAFSIIILSPTFPCLYTLSKPLCMETREKRVKSII